MTLVRVHPPDLDAASAGLAGDDPALTGAARLLGDGAATALDAVAGDGVLAAALTGWAEVEGTVARTLAEAVRGLSAALASAAAAYAAAESTARVDLGSRRPLPRLGGPS